MLDLKQRNGIVSVIGLESPYQQYYFVREEAASTLHQVLEEEEEEKNKTLHRLFTGLLLGGADLGLTYFSEMPPFRNRYMVVEAFLDQNRDFAGDETIMLTQFNVSKAIKDSIQFNFGKCGLAGSFHGSLKVCKTVALKYDEEKFEHYKLTAKDGNSPQLLQEVHNYFEKIKALEL